MLKLITKLNPDSEFVENFRKQIEDNDGYCPCSVAKSKNTKCMCKKFREQSLDGYCHCGLYYKELTNE